MRKKILFFAFFLIYGNLLARPARKIYVFFLPDCDDCKIFKEKLLFDLENKINFKLEPVFLNLKIDSIYNRFIQIKNKYHLTQYETPIIFYNFKLYSGLTEIMNDFPKNIKENDKNWKVFDIWNNFTLNENNKANTKKIDIAFFYKTKCGHCNTVDLFLQKIKNKYPNANIKKFDIIKKHSMEYIKAFCELYHINEESGFVPPLLIIGKRYITHENFSEILADSIISSIPLDSTKINWNKIIKISKHTQNEVAKTFFSFNIFSIMVAGFLDGINPCAFATLLFFISYLTILNRKKREILISGISFITGDFISYMLMGSVVLRFLQSLLWLSYLTKILYLLTAILAFVMAYYSFYDYFLAKKGNFKDMKLQLSNKKKRKIHDIIRKKIKVKSLIFATFIMGFLVSLQELACTGQIYLPTIIYMTKISTYKLQAYLYLLIYNLVFLIPLIAVFIISYAGITSKKLNSYFSANIQNIKIITGIFFILLGGGLIYLLF